MVCPSHTGPEATPGLPRPELTHSHWLPRILASEVGGEKDDPCGGDSMTRAKIQESGGMQGGGAGRGVNA